MSHFNGLFNVFKKNELDYDVFLHTWEMEGGRQNVWDQYVDTLIDYQEYRLLEPKFYQIDNQKEFLDQIDFSQYFYQNIWDKIGQGQHGEGEWLPDMIRNHLCSLESQRRVYQMVIDANQDYDYIMLVRPDVEIINLFPVKEAVDYLSTVKNGIVLINGDHGEGYNDRFAFLNFETSGNYMMRINELADFRKQYGRIVGEKYVKFICDKYYQPKFVDFAMKIIRPPK